MTDGFYAYSSLAECEDGVALLYENDSSAIRFVKIGRDPACRHADHHYYHDNDDGDRHAGQAQASQLG